MTTTDKLRELAALDEKATQGKWRVAGTDWSEDTVYVKHHGPMQRSNSAFIFALVNWWRSGGKELAEDGLRYRWLRVRINNGSFGSGTERLADAALDAAIDAARAKEGK